jgi:hypothetical protein
VKLSPADRKNLMRFEETIREGICRAKAGLIEVGTALANIREGRLYRESFDNFDDYCRERWGFSRQRAHQLVHACQLSTVVDNERQARELLGLTQEDAQAVVAVAETQGPLTAETIKTARQLLEDATAGLEGRDKREAQAKILRDEASANRPRQPSRIAGCNGILADISKRLDWCQKKWSGLSDIADQADFALNAVRRELDRLAEIINSSTDERAAA